jgi:hypothetical protein
MKSYLPKEFREHLLTVWRLRDEGKKAKSRRLFDKDCAPVILQQLPGKEPPDSERARFFGSLLRLAQRYEKQRS